MTPISTRVVMFGLLSLVIRVKVKKRTPTPKAKEVICTPSVPAEKKKMATPTPKLAAWVTPSTSGAARGFRYSPCMTAPEAERAAPTSTARIERGMRTL